MGKRHTVSILDSSGAWVVHHTPFTLVAAQDAYNEKLKEVKKKKKGGVRLTSPTAVLLDEFIFSENEEGETINKTTSQMTLF